MRIQIIEDTVCPWCRIGKHNLNEALAEWTKTNDEPVEIEYLPFLLDPVEPGSKENFRQRFAERKGIGPAQFEQMFARVTEVGRQAGITFNFDKIEIAVDTVPGHELIQLAPAEKKPALIEAIMKAYFEDGKDISEDDILIAAAREAGLTEDELGEIEPIFRSHVNREAVLAMIAQVQRAGISGVPFFIIDGKLGVSGAQPVPQFLAAFEQAKTLVPAAQ